MNTFQEYISKHLIEHLNKRRIVVWYDPRNEFVPYVEELYGGESPTNCRVEKLSIDGQEMHLCQYCGSFYEVRSEIEPYVEGDAPEPMIIYIPGVERNRKNSVLMEMEKAGTCYEPQLKRLARNVLRQQFSDGVIDEMLKPENIGYEDILRLLEQEGEKPSVLKVIFEGARDNASLIAAWLANPSQDKKIDEKQARGELYKLVRARLGLDLGEEIGLDEARNKTLRYVLVGEFRADLRCDPPASLQMIPEPSTKEYLQFVREVAEIKRVKYVDTYVELADQVETDFGLAQEPLEPSALGSVDTFRFEEKTLLNLAGELIYQGEYTGALEVISERNRSFWVDRSIERQSQWTACRLIAELGVSVATAQSRLGDVKAGPSAWVHAYTAQDGFYTVDLAQRNLEAWVAKMENEPETEKALEVVRQAYEDLLQKMSTSFTEAFSKAGWSAPDALQQTRVFPEFVEGAGSQVAYFLVDAMRYEMAVELGNQLENAQDVVLKPAVAALPTITLVGMAALLPGASASFGVIDHKAKPAASIDGKPLPDLRARMRFLKARVPGMAEMDLGKLLQMSTKKLANKVEGVPLIVVRSQEIDALGEIGSNILARQLMDTTVGNVARAVRKLAGLGVQHFVISADHGHQFTREKEEAFRTDSPGGNTLALHRRCWIGRGGGNPPGTVRVTGSELGYDTELDFVFPTGIGVFQAPGGLAYHHGGLSLQELIVPVLSLRMPVSVEKPTIEVEVILSGVPQKLSNRTFGITLDLTGLFATKPMVVRPVLLSEGVQVGEAGMAVDADFDASTRCVTLHPKKPASVALVLEREDCKKVRVVIQEPATDRVLAQSDDIPVKLGI